MNRLPHAMTAMLLVLTLAPAANAQQPREPIGPPAPMPPPVAPSGVYTPPMQAGEVQEQLREVLRQYPPSLRQVLALDPTLMNRPDYLAPYPALVAFLQQHPEVSRNPSYFFGGAYFQDERSPELRRIDALQGTLAAAAFFSGFIVVISIVYSLLRQAIEYRRWRRQVQIQTDMQNKLVDKLSTSQELQTYLENVAGRRVMEWPAPPVVASSWMPLTRILWSVQIGIVIAAVGVGFLVTRRMVPDDDFFGVFQVMGTLAIAVGVGFVVSAVASWMLSARLGLLEPASKADA